MRKKIKTSKYPTELELKAARKQLDKGIASELLTSDATPVERFKYKLCEKFIIYKREHQLSQKELAKILEIDESLMSKILHYHAKEFTTDRLIKYLALLYPTLEVTIDVAS